MKKILIFLLLGFFVFSLSGCGNSNKSGMHKIQDEIKVLLSKSHNTEMFEQTLKVATNNLKELSEDVNNSQEVRQHALYGYYFTRSMAMMGFSDEKFRPFESEATYLELSVAGSKINKAFLGKDPQKIENIEEELVKIKTVCQKIEQNLRQKNN